jgi:hypothetical protein
LLYNRAEVYDSKGAKHMANCRLEALMELLGLLFLVMGHMCQIYGPGVFTSPVYVTIARLSAQQPSRRRPARADAIDERGDQGKPRRAYLDDS